MTQAPDGGREGSGANRDAGHPFPERQPVHRRGRLGAIPGEGRRLPALAGEGGRVAGGRRYGAVWRVVKGCQPGAVIVALLLAACTAPAPGAPAGPPAAT